ncbi:hypothetical protein Poli38472_009760 [Pythium oligandrum]|uniref:Uncharacterized protein n=1 Tax=Pythium oligandrum TaxID=41045 RepID=A0A8K1FJX8_PYTOL|nr:hypothetical protein Poli38472_009760 [Pythium oligandrum]|eukprot:TMW62267.1 hypothetical protein Poli38472_009760 [Pythium oligandrum]
MGGKAKFQKHTAKELQGKADAHRNRGGGKTGTEQRMVAKLNFTCEICMSASPDIKSFEAHYVNKHPRAEFNKDEFVAKAEAARQASFRQVTGTHHNGGRAAGQKK